MTATPSSPRSAIAAYQCFLNDMGFPAGPCDGIWGPRTQSAHLAYEQSKLQNLQHNKKNLIFNDIREIQKEIGTRVDGNFGVMSRQAARRYLSSLCPDNPFPTYSGRTSFYGPNGEQGGYTPPMKSFSPAFPVYLFDDKHRVNTISAHVKCVESLENIFKELASIYTSPNLQTSSGINKFFGIYNPRNVRGGSSISNHSWAIAIDLNANQNGLNTPWPATATMPWEVIKVFAKHGWSNGGIVWGRDAMHFEAVRS
jgi:hypothetical protein